MKTAMQNPEIKGAAPFSVAFSDSFTLYAKDDEDARRIAESTRLSDWSRYQLISQNNEAIDERYIPDYAAKPFLILLV